MKTETKLVKVSEISPHVEEKKNVDVPYLSDAVVFDLLRKTCFFEKKKSELYVIGNKKKSPYTCQVKSLPIMLQIRRRN